MGVIHTYIWHRWVLYLYDAVLDLILKIFYFKTKSLLNRLCIIDSDIQV